MNVVDVILVAIAVAATVVAVYVIAKGRKKEQTA